MADSLQTWTAHADPFTEVVASITDWDAQSPCDGWTARNVVDHVVDTEREFLTGQGFDLPNLDHSDPSARWRAHDAKVRELLAEPGVGDKTYDGHFGPTTVGETLSQFYGFDLLVHRWDLAASHGERALLTDPELDEIDSAVTGWGEHAYAPGIFARPVDVPTDADRQAEVLARTGRVDRVTTATR
ncbi:maleylpyruvate isomerase N-terminal domain-containing protein [Yimella sp. NH-Cas1]|uniref:maleylpyruvate isomerase N-terminal domain-containing protein n=1 Tax=Yimella sp. NH-Cas1 TaxID=2917726 RepID=UPI001EFB87FD|nr:maleylpyruvate isomerase N-terminal domain-containing protein [Yimella sp. NH-Cas1]MCG8656296.1 maleylpyruvate isomerase N-terminal domain-containing protein [Yimella sp. NH-Cas1]